MTRSILDCSICARLPQKSSSDRPPKGADALVDAPAETRRCPECGTFYYHRYDHDPGEPMVPASDTYILMRLTPVLARAQLQDAPAAQPFLEALAQDWDHLHAAFAAAAATSIESPHIVKQVVESLTDHYLEHNDKAAFVSTLLESPQPAVRANAGTDFLYVATEEHQVWTVRAFSRHQQRLAFAWLDDEGFKRAILESLVSCLEANDETVSIDATFGNRPQHACETAYFGLSNGFYRKLDPAPVLPALRALAAGDAPHRALAQRLLEDIEKGT